LPIGGIDNSDGDVMVDIHVTDRVSQYGVIRFRHPAGYDSRSKNSCRVHSRSFVRHLNTHIYTRTRGRYSWYRYDI